MSAQLEWVSDRRPEKDEIAATVRETFRTFWQSDTTDLLRDASRSVVKCYQNGILTDDETRAVLRQLLATEVGFHVRSAMENSLRFTPVSLNWPSFSSAASQVNPRQFATFRPLFSFGG